MYSLWSFLTMVFYICQQLLQRLARWLFIVDKKAQGKPNHSCIQRSTQEGPQRIPVCPANLLTCPTRGWQTSPSKQLSHHLRVCQLPADAVPGSWLPCWLELNSFNEFLKCFLGFGLNCSYVEQGRRATVINNIDKLPRTPGKHLLNKLAFQAHCGKGSLHTMGACL